MDWLLACYFLFDSLGELNASFRGIEYNRKGGFVRLAVPRYYALTLRFISFTMALLFVDSVFVLPLFFSFLFFSYDELPV